MKNYFVRFSLASGLIVLGLSFASPFSFSQGQRSGGQMVPAKAEFLDDKSDRILSDGLGAYVDGRAQCVTANVSSAGYFYLRTVTNRCSTNSPRHINIDFTDALNNPVNCPGFISCPHGPIKDDFGQGTLDMCGLNSLLDVTIRAQRLFEDPIPANQLTEVQIYFNLSPDFKNSAFYLTGAAYIQQGNTLNERVLTTGADRAEFYLVMIKKTGERVCLGNYYMPFTIRVTKGV